MGGFALLSAFTRFVFQVIEVYRFLLNDTGMKTNKSAAIQPNKKAQTKVA